MPDLPEMSVAVLQRAVAGDAAALRCVTRLQPAGGRGAKVFPPVYGADGTSPTRYVFDRRRINGEDVETVLLDSAASQAGRMEEALLAAWQEQRLRFPVIAIDFSRAEGIQDLGRITTLQVPHRIADALLRDSVDDAGIRFRETPAGRAYADGSARNATSIFLYWPTALVFGAWDSTNPRGGLGHKVQRALVSEIVGVRAVAGEQAAARSDPAGIEANLPAFPRSDDRDDWTAEDLKALLGKGKPVLFRHESAEGQGRSSVVNHGNVTPSIEVSTGGVTVDYALHTVVLSFLALRRLRFPTNAQGSHLTNEHRVDAERAARTALAALALAAIAEQRDRGFHLRSRSSLVPETAGPLVLEVIAADGTERDRYVLSTAGAARLLALAMTDAAIFGFPWEREPLTLKPAPRLAALIRDSRRQLPVR
jgi:CRISPR-associated protein Csb1